MQDRRHRRLERHAFVLIEQGKFKADGEVHNLLVAVDVAQATDLTGKKLAGGLELEYASTLGELSVVGVSPRNGWKFSTCARKMRAESSSSAGSRRKPKAWPWWMRTRWR